MSLIRIIDTFVSLDIVKEYTMLEEKLVWTEYGHKGKQCGLQYKQGDDPWISAVGRSKGDELQYSEINPFFKDTVFEYIIKKYKLLRTRLMWVGPYACYSMHKDETPRIHLPLITNPDCYFIFKSKPPLHLGVDTVFWTDTRMLHSFMNCSDQPRLHLIGAVES